MRKIVFLSLLLALATTSFCQQAVQKPGLASKDYLQKSKRQKNTALILLAVGAGLIVTSELIPSGEPMSQGICIYCRYENDGIKGTFGFSGVGVMLGSIPFFIASRKNKKRASKVSVFINIEKTPVLQGVVFSSQSFPVIGMRKSL